MESIAKVLDRVDRGRRIDHFVLGGQAHFQRDAVRAQNFLARYHREHRPDVDLPHF
jgi:hypothetical protein